MKKSYTLIFIALFTMLGLKANADGMWLVGEGFNGWSTTGSTVMTDDGNGIYSWSGSLTAGSSFAFFKDSENWGSQRGPDSGDGSAPTGDWENTKSGGAWKLTTSGSYVIQYNHNTDKAKIALAEEPIFNPTQRIFAVTGAAFGNWNMPPSGDQIFANNGDGTYTLVYEGAKAAGFKLSSIGINEDFNSWNVFNSGVMGASNLAVGDNSLSTSFGTGDMTFPVSGNVTLTISNVTATSCNLNITLTQEIIPDKAYYLIGKFNEWNADTKVPFVENEGVFTLTKTFSGEFKIINENGNWLGGSKTLTAEENTISVASDDGGNMVLVYESQYTLTIENDVLTVTGFPGPKVLAGVVKDNANRPISGVKVTAVPIVQSANGIRILEEETGYTTTTANDGTFSLEVPGGPNYSVSFELYGYVSQTVGEGAIENVYLDWDPSTGITTLIESKNVASVKYVNAIGMMSDTPFNGLNIVVVTYQNGTRKVIKIVK